MTRVFFSFDHSMDTRRAAVVREHWITTPEREATGFWEAPGGDIAQKLAEDTMRRRVNAALEGTSVTVVLIGPWTASRSSVQYEIKRSIQHGNGLLGVRVHTIKGQRGLTTLRGVSPLPSQYGLNGRLFSPPVYDWWADGGPGNLGAWIEEAVQAAGC